MSIVAHGNSTLDWVCRWSSGFCSALIPLIHIFAGENVCIHVITPTHVGSELAARAWRWIAGDSVSTGWKSIVNGIAAEALSCSTMAADCSATWRSVVSP